MFEPLPDHKLPQDAPAFARKLNVYRTMAHNAELLRAWAPLRAHVVLGGALTEAQKEIVILRTGYHWGSAYERAHHVVRGRLAGLSDARIARTAKASEEWGVADEDTALMAATDALLTHGRLSEAELKALDPALVLDIMATIGFYTTLAFIVNSFETPIDSDIAMEGVPQ
ncbi:carboxymuconolactone decarboxylase family protein [Polymorphobacter sp.]|uniref:carboxymuconolactone decarboxylase family protein n=1 Tax=Polymorphobacter sp. TaxID=1909290 RepID=UPI003F6E82C8